MKIIITDNIDWNEYKKKVDEIMCSDILLSITWDLSEMTIIPWQYIPKQIELMKYYRPIMPLHIKDNIVILPNKQWKQILEFIFTIIPPIVPISLQYK